MRYFIELAYDGGNYHGWQRQPDAQSVQEVVEHALSTLLKQETPIVGAGRTDTGVHARQLFAHFDCNEPIDAPHLQYRLNSFLPPDIAVNDLFQVKEDAHARFDATAREYEYWITLEKDPFLEKRAHRVAYRPDLQLLNAAAAVLLDYNDFQCFSRSNTDVKTYHCDIKKSQWEQRGNLLVFTIRADRFLRNMVRAVVGTLLDIGQGKMDVDQIHDIIKSKDRSEAGASAPAHGLYLKEVSYPEHIKS